MRIELAAARDGSGKGRQEEQAGGEEQGAWGVRHGPRSPDQDGGKFYHGSWRGQLRRWRLKWSTVCRTARYSHGMARDRQVENRTGGVGALSKYVAYSDNTRHVPVVSRHFSAREALCAPRKVENPQRFRVHMSS